MSRDSRGPMPLPTSRLGERVTSRCGISGKHTADPFNATMLGVSGFDDLVPDPGRAGSAGRPPRRLPPSSGGPRHRPRRPGRRPTGSTTRPRPPRRGACGPTWSTHLGGRAPRPTATSRRRRMMFMAVPSASAARRGGRRAATSSGSTALPAFFDAIGSTATGQAAARRAPIPTRGRRPARRSTSSPATSRRPGRRRLVPSARAAGRRRRTPGAGPRRRDHPRVRVRPACAGWPACWRTSCCPWPGRRPGRRPASSRAARKAYAAAVRRHTTTDLGPEEIHQIGLAVLADLRARVGRAGRPGARHERRAVGPGPAAQRPGAALPALGRRSSTWSRDALRAARRRSATTGSPRTTSPTASSRRSTRSRRATRRSPTTGRRRATAPVPARTACSPSDPQERFTYEYEALAFHESTPGHHLQIASAQTLTGLPDYRRFLDAEVCAYVEGWGLYSERLADEMGLYTSDLQRLGMLSFDALRACRLVVDTGMHAFGWSRRAGHRLHVVAHRDDPRQRRSTRSTATSPGPGRRWPT